MKSVLKRLNSVGQDILTSLDNILVRTLIISNTTEKHVHATVYIDRADPAAADIIIFSGNVYRNLNASVYFSKDMQFYLDAGDKIVGSAEYLDGTGPDEAVADLVLSYEGNASEGSTNFLNYNRSPNENTNHVNWGLLRGALQENIPGWGA